MEIRRIGRIGAIDDIVSNLLRLHISRAADGHPSPRDQISGHRITEDKRIRQFSRRRQLDEIRMGLEKERSHLKNVTLFLSEHLIGNGLMLSQNLKFGLAKILGHGIEIFRVILLIITHPFEMCVGLLAILNDLVLQIFVACRGAGRLLAPLGKPLVWSRSTIRRVNLHRRRLSFAMAFVLFSTITCFGNSQGISVAVTIFMRASSLKASIAA